MSTAASPSSETEPSDATELARDARLHVLAQLHGDLDAVAAGHEVQGVDGAHLQAGHADRRALLQAGDVIEDGLQPVLLPGKSSLAAQQEDEDAGHQHREDGDEADLQFGPGKRTRARHGC